MQRYSRDLGREVGSSFLLTRSTGLKPYLQKVLPCKHPCHSSDLGLGTPCELALNVTPNQQYMMALSKNLKQKVDK